MKEAKLRPKYAVFKLTTTGDHAVVDTSKKMLATDPNDTASPFVLMPRKDPAAFIAMEAYMECCEPCLATEIREWLQKIAVADPVYGTQGVRNRKAMRLKYLAGRG